MKLVTWGRTTPLLLILLLQLGCIRQDSHLQKPVLQVNSNTLTAKEFADRLSTKLRTVDAVSAKDPRHLDRARDSILREFIVESLVADWAQEHNLKPSSESVEQELERVREGYPDDLALRRVLTQEKVSPAKWRQSIERRLTKQIVMERLRAEMPAPTEEQIRQFYNDHRQEFVRPKAVQLRQVVTAKENDAERILASLKSGADLEQLAREFSTAPERAEGGLTDWIEEGVLEVFDRAFNMRQGELSPVLESPFGFHIFRVVQKRNQRQLTLEEARPKIIQTLLMEKEQHRYKAWLETQIRRAQVFKDEKLLESIKIETRH